MSQADLAFEVAKYTIGGALGFAFKVLYDFWKAEASRSEVARAMIEEIKINTELLNKRLADKEADMTNIKRGNYVKKVLWQSHQRRVFESNQYRLSKLPKEYMTQILEFYQLLKVIDAIAKFSEQLPEKAAAADQIAIVIQQYLSFYDRFYDFLNQAMKKGTELIPKLKSLIE